MIKGGIPTALFDTDSIETGSALFYVTRGWTVVLSAYGFSRSPLPIDPDKFKAMQRACLHRVITRTVEFPQELPCGVFPEVGANTRVEVIAEAPVIVNGREWSLNACGNLAFLGVPGIYRLVLNDPAAAGNVQVYMEYYHNSELIYRPGGLYFGG
jgi:hypothetical protein